MIRLVELNLSSRSIPVGPVSSLIINRVSSSITYLSYLIDPQTGQMPAYGSNDGALVLPLNNCDFTDYRPLLQLGSYITKQQFLFESGPWDEDTFWLCGKQALSRAEQSGSEVEAGVREKTQSFPDGGIYLLHGSNSKAVIRCTDHHSRPSHADQLHVDLWMRDINIACDAGTYLYSGEDPWRNGLAHTAVHNTVTVDHLDQMKMLTRFTWTNWSHGKTLRHDENIWQGEHYGYKRLADPVAHKRTVMSLGEDRWLIIDYLNATKSHHYALQWLLRDFPFEQQGNLLLLSVDSLKYKIQCGLMNENGNFSVVRADPTSTRGWRSQYYGVKEPAISAMLEIAQVSATFWSFFGFEGDEVRQAGTMLEVNSQQIDLAQLNK